MPSRSDTRSGDPGDPPIAIETPPGRVRWPSEHDRMADPATRV